MRCAAQFFKYTGDPTGLLATFFDRIMGRTYMLLARRAQALSLDATDPAYGMLTGNDNEDLGSSEIECGTTHPDGDLGDCQTELPYVERPEGREASWVFLHSYHLLTC